MYKHFIFRLSIGLVTSLPKLISQNRCLCCTLSFLFYFPLHDYHYDVQALASWRKFCNLCNKASFGRLANNYFVLWRWCFPKNLSMPRSVAIKPMKLSIDSDTNSRRLYKWFFLVHFTQHGNYYICLLTFVESVFIVFLI